MLPGRASLSVKLGTVLIVAWGKEFYFFDSDFFLNFGWQEWVEMEQVRETLQSSNLQIYEFKAATMPDSLYIYLTLFSFLFYLFCSYKVTWFLWEGFRFKEKDWFYADTILFSVAATWKEFFFAVLQMGLYETGSIELAKC